MAAILQYHLSPSQVIDTEALIPEATTVSTTSHANAGKELSKFHLCRIAITIIVAIDSQVH
jgi:hypothetical protein